MLTVNTSDVEFSGLSYYIANGHFSDLLYSVTGIDRDNTFAVRIKHDDKLAPNSDAHFQVALLYTNVFGERRIRVHSLWQAGTGTASGTDNFNSRASVYTGNIMQF